MPEIGAGGRSREVWLAFRRITGVNLVVHLLGAVLTFCYFRFIEVVLRRSQWKSSLGP